MHDTLYGGRQFRTFNVIEKSNRGALAIEVGTSIPSVGVIRVLERLIEMYGKPEALRVDNGPEFTESRLPNGASSMASRCYTSSLESRIRMPTWSDSTARTNAKC